MGLVADTLASPDLDFVLDDANTHPDANASFTTPATDNGFATYAFLDGESDLNFPY